MKDAVTQFVVSLIEENGKLPSDVQLDTFNYVESGYVDSIGLIKFVVEIEEEFNIELTEDDLAHQDFKTIGGLVNIICLKSKRLQ
jgi:acyl carrier protein